MNLKKLLLVSITVVALSGFSLREHAVAGSFGLFEGSTDQNANAYAGQGAKAYDAGTAWANPAGMVRLDQDEIDGSFNFIEPSFKFHGSDTDFPDAATAGAASRNVSAIYGALTPATYSVVSITPDLKFGLAIKSPFGARIAYPGNWVGRYQSINSNLTDIAVEPSLAYAITPRFSIGGGPVFDYFSIRETQDVRPALGSQYGDIYADAHGIDWGVGYNVAGLYQFDPDTRLGISYRARIEHRADLEQTLTESPGLANSPLGALVAGVLALQNTPGHPYAQGVEKFNLPDSVDASFYRQISPEWAVMAEAIWTHWQIFNNVAITTFGTGNAPTIIDFDFHNSWFGSAGASYRPRWMPRLLLQTGLGYDEDPTSDATRQAQIPTQDRLLVAFGFTYDITRGISLDLAYNHYFPMGSNRIDATGPSLANALELSAGRLVGGYSDQIDSFSAGFKIRF
jgi:long-chain fatty acid transport protein